MCGGMCKGTHEGMHKGVHEGMHKGMCEGMHKGGREKNQNFMLIRFLKASNLIGCGGEL